MISPQKSSFAFYFFILLCIILLNIKLFPLVCIFKCQTRTRMKSHLRIHTGEKVVACSTCGVTFATNTKYMDHCSRKTPVLGPQLNFTVPYVILG